MTITKTIDGKKVTLIAEGMIDTANSAAFETAVDEVVDNANPLIIDFEKVGYCSSSGLRVLLKAQKKISANNSEMEIVNVSSVIREVFDMTGFSEILTIK